MHNVSKAFVLASGHGNRLRLSTRVWPKSLIPTCQKPLITFALDHLIETGVNKFVINTHRCPELFQGFFSENRYRDCPVRIIHEPDLLETDGVIKNAERDLGTDPFLTYSGDTLTDDNHRAMVT